MRQWQQDEHQSSEQFPNVVVYLARRELKAGKSIISFTLVPTVHTIYRYTVYSTVGAPAYKVGNVTPTAIRQRLF